MTTETDIMVLMQKDPLKHTEQDIDAIIKKMRDQRHAFNTVQTKAPKTAKSTQQPLDLGDISL